MANLTRTYRWLRYIPDLGDNRELPKPFYLELTSGLTKLALAGFYERLRVWSEEKHEGAEAFVEATTALLSPHVRMGAEPLSLEGRPITTLREYIAMGLDVLGESPVLELVRMVREYNELGEGPKLVFFERPSGGTSTTPIPSTERAASEMVAPSNGSESKPWASSAGPA